MLRNTQPHNRPIKQLIAWYEDKNSGRVVDARREIQRRFTGLDWTDQKRLLMAFLDSTKTDRQWAYSQVYKYWDKDFEEKVKQLWEQFHEVRCAWLVIKYLPYDYVMSEFDLLCGGRNYFFICQRFANRDDFVIERDFNLISPIDYLIVHAYSNCRISNSDALDVMFRIVHGCCVDLGKEQKIDTFDNELACPLAFSDVTRAIFFLRELGCNEAINAFTRWNDRVKRIIRSSDEYRFLENQHAFVDNELYFSRQYLHMAYKYAYLALDSKYRLATDPELEDILEVVRGPYVTVIGTTESRLRFS